jgi:hypothetical protein
VRTLSDIQHKGTQVEETIGLAARAALGNHRPSIRMEFPSPPPPFGELAQSGLIRHTDVDRASWSLKFRRPHLGDVAGRFFKAGDRQTRSLLCFIKPSSFIHLKPDNPGSQWPRERSEGQFARSEKVMRPGARTIIVRAPSYAS